MIGPEPAGVKISNSNLVDAFLDHHFVFRPVDATFMGLAGHDARLPPATATTLAEEKRGLDRLDALIGGAEASDAVGERLDLRLIRSEIALGRAALARPRLANPAWYTGEAAFGVMSLLLPQSEPTPSDFVLARLAATADFLSDGRARLNGGGAPASWRERARREAAAMASFLDTDLAAHPAWDQRWRPPASDAARAFRAFADGVDSLSGAGVDAACGERHLALLMREGHGLAMSPAEIARRAANAFQQIGEELDDMAARLDPARSWKEILAGLAHLHPASPEAVPASYQAWHDRASVDGAALVTPEHDYALDFRPITSWFRTIAKTLYFLSYRCPPAGRAGAGSVYWVASPGEDADAYLRGQNTAAIKTTHAVHHGSIGHHTQNARARVASSRLGRLGGVDCALGVAFLSAGTLIEGWACHAVDLMAEAPGFYTPEEMLLIKASERRNAASVLVDIRLHTGEWTPEQAAAFYRDEAGFPAARVVGEVTRNTMLPGTRLMYWVGVEAIRDLRRRWRGETRAFHDALLGYGHVPVSWIADEMDRAGLLSP